MQSSNGICGVPVPTNLAENDVACLISLRVGAEKIPPRFDISPLPTASLYLPCEPELFAAT